MQNPFIEKSTRTFGRFGLGAVAATLMLVGSSLALAGPEHAGHGGNGPNSEFDPGRKLAYAVRRLDLTGTQEDAIRSLFEANREDMIANREASREVREDLQALMQEDTLDQEALAELAEREGELAEERVLLGGTLASRVLAELDDAQREELAAMRGQHQERRRARFSAREDRDG
jgi:Spy/CpxP family protein refolding chaperone